MRDLLKLTFIWMNLLSICWCFDFNRLTNFEGDGLAYEIIFGVLLVLCIANFFHGKLQNEKVALDLFTKVVDVLYENFAVIGEQGNETLLVKTNSTATEKDSVKEGKVNSMLDSNIEKFLLLEDMQDKGYMKQMVEVDSAYYYRLFCTGRKNIRWAFVDVQTKRRQDLVTNLFYSIIMPENDKVSIELKLSNPEAKAVAYILKNKNVKRALDEFKDLKALGKKFGVLKNKCLNMYCENEEVRKKVFTEEVIKGIERNCFLIENLDISDCIEHKVTSGVFLRLTFSLFSQRKFDRMQQKYLSNFKFDLQGRDNISAYTELVNMMLIIGDNLNNMKLSQKTRDSMATLRKELLSGKTKEDEKKEKIENQQRLREERMKKMTKKEKEKFLEKTEKRRRDRMMKKFKVVKGA